MNRRNPAPVDWSPLWSLVAIPPIPALAELREAVLLRSEHRMPKWAFRVATDFAVQFQPKPVPHVGPRALASGRKQRLLSFEGAVLLMPKGVGVNCFRVKPRLIPEPCLHMRFLVYAEVADEWVLQVRGVKRRAPGEAFGVPEALATRARLVESLATPRWEKVTPELMLSPACLLCGKRLDDPASMARMYGPECSGTASLVAPMVSVG